MDPVPRQKILFDSNGSGASFQISQFGNSSNVINKRYCSTHSYCYDIKILSKLYQFALENHLKRWLFRKLIGNDPRSKN